MNDADIDQRLIEHGAAWREANNLRPGIDWDAVTRSSRPSRSRVWLAVAGVAAVVAIVVGIVFVAVDRSEPQPASASAAPAGFFAIFNGSAKYVRGGHTLGVFSGLTALGVLPSGRAAFFAMPRVRCRTDLAIANVNPVPAHPHQQRMWTPFDTSGILVLGRVAPVPMAISRDGSKLAWVENGVGRSPSGGCATRVERLVVLDRPTHQVSFWSIPVSETLNSLHWAPDGQSIAFVIGPVLGTCSSDCGRSGTYVKTLATDGSLGNAGGGSLVLPLSRTSQPYGPVFWWHGQLVSATGGELRRVTNGRLGAVVASGLPKEVLTVSSDGSGDHLLLSGYLASERNSLNPVPEPPATYRWDAGKLTKVAPPPGIFHGSFPPHWTQPGW